MTESGDVTSDLDVELVRHRIEVVRDRVADAGGDADGITLVVVTKGFGPEVASLARAAGALDLGENYAQELVAKADALATDGLATDGAEPAPRWHAIGRLQRNKVRSLAGVVALWQAVDRAELGAEIARRAPGAEVLVQVNVTGEPQKGGCAPADAHELLARLRDTGLAVCGLMTIGRTGSPDAATDGFNSLARLADRLDLPVRSMGMSGDLEAAVAAGSTMIRVGAAIFGPRPGPPAT